MMTPLERTQATLGMHEADRVPVFLSTGLLGARMVGKPIEEYFSRVGYVVEGQQRMADYYGGDSVSAYPYAAAEMEAWGAETLFRTDGPPVCGRPPVASVDQIDRLRTPSIHASAALERTLEGTRRLKQIYGETMPISGVAISPFTLPVMQMGFAAYLELMVEGGERFERLMAVNEEFTVAWANAQLEAGATAIVYVDPVASTTIIPRKLYLRRGWPVACRTLPRIRSATVTHMASGRCLEILEDLIATGTAGVAVSCLEDLGELRRRAAGRITILGNLNAIAMRHWTPQQAEEQVRRTLAEAGPGGGFVLTDNHGEIPWQVPDEVLLAVRAAAGRWGSRAGGCDG